MTFLFTISLPFKDPILIFVLALIIIPLAPMPISKDFSDSNIVYILLN